MPNLRRLHSRDALTLTGLDAICFPEKPWKVDHFQDSLNSGGFGFVLTNGNIPVGFIFAKTTENETEILRIATLPAFQRQGYADALLIALEKSLSPNHAIFLEVRSQNTPAQQLYLKHKFEKITERKNYYTNPTDHAHVYRKEVK